MISIWAKIIKEEHLIKNELFDVDVFTFKEMPNVMASICEKLDIPTPIVLKKHFLELGKFKHTNFLADHFIESVNFDKLAIEMVRQ